ncbi:Major facilitator superfamily protein [Euphorbia peplus]|nr:Major facilitator superfamily protein [Euphorbia peplus]
MKLEDGDITKPLLLENYNADCEQCSTPQSHCCSSFNLTLLFSTLVAVSGSYVHGTCLGYSSPARTGIVDELGLTTAQYSLFGSLLTIGGMLGAIFSGRIADMLGRKGAMAVSNILCILGWSAIMFTKNVFLLDAGRFMMGCGIGLFSYVVHVYVAEITPQNMRGSLTFLNQLMAEIGKALTFVIGSLVNWRTLALIGIIPCLFQLLGLWFIPESPRWLAKIGCDIECESSLQRLRGEGADVSEEISDIKDYTELLKKISEDGIFDLFLRKYAHALTVGVGLMVFQQLGGVTAFNFYASTILDSAGFSSTAGSITASLIQIITTVLGVLLIDKYGRRVLLLISAIGTTLGCFLAGLSFLFQDLHINQEIVSVLVFFGVVVFFGFFGLGLGGIPWVIMSEIFPINIKGSAGSLVTLVSWGGAWFVSYTFNFLFDWSSAGTFFLYTAISGAGVVFIVKIVKETKGRTLEEIQTSITSVH